MKDSMKKLFGRKADIEDSANMNLVFELNEAKDGLVVTGTKNSESNGEVTIPSWVKFEGKKYPVTEIGERAFWHGEMDSVVISDNIVLIDKCAFFFCENLRKVVIGKTVSEIQDEAFSHCTSLTSFFIPDNVKTIGRNAFSGSSLTAISIPDSVTSIGEYAFAFCKKLTEVEVGVSLKKIPKGAFYGCEALSSDNVKKIVSKVETVEEEAFKGCGIIINKIPEVLDSVFQENEVTLEDILEIVFHCHYSYPTRPGQELEITKETSVLEEYFFSLIELDGSILIKEASLRMRYKKGERLESFSFNTTDKDDLLSVLLWIRQSFPDTMNGKHELSSWYRNKVQEELADYVAGNTIEMKNFKYPFRISKVVVSYEDLEKVSLGFSDLYNQKGRELAKRGFRVPTLEEWLHFANSSEGQQILQNQYKNAKAYEICQPDTHGDLHINTKTHQLAYLDYEYRRVHPGPLRDGFYRYVQSSVPLSDIFPKGYVNQEAEDIRIKEECEYEEYLERREPWDC